MTDLHAIGLIAVMSLVTMALRFLPFLLFGGSKKVTAFVSSLGRVLPYAIMGMLVVYCLKNVSLMQAPHGLPEGIAVAVVAGLHLWKRNALLSIGLGTVCYMLLVQLVF